MTMRYRLMATYQGVPYEAGVGPSGAEVVLFAACPPPEELGFEPATGHWRKQMRVHEVQALWESRPVGRFRGEACLVLDDLGDRLHIAYLGHDARKAVQLGYWQVDRGVFELVTAREEVADVVEERSDYPRRAARGSAPAGDGEYSGYAAGPAFAPPYGPDGGSRRDLAVMPPASEPPLPVEAEARRAAAARQVSSAPQQPAAQVPLPAPAPPGLVTPAQADARPLSQPGTDGAGPRRRRSARPRMATQRIFADLAGRAGIPGTAFAIGGEVDGAICLLATPGGFEVFNASAGARHEVRQFADEESAYFYLFGVLAADAVRTGRLAPRG